MRSCLTSQKHDIKNNTIHKRLSWNYGQQANPTSGTTNSSLSSSRLIRSGLGKAEYST